MPGYLFIDLTTVALQKLFIMNFVKRERFILFTMKKWLLGPGMVQRYFLELHQD